MDSEYPAAVRTAGKPSVAPGGGFTRQGFDRESTLFGAFLTTLDTPGGARSHRRPADGDGHAP